MTDANRSVQQHCTNCGVFTSDQALSVCSQCAASQQQRTLAKSQLVQAAQAPAVCVAAAAAAGCQERGEAQLSACCADSSCSLLSSDAEAAIALLRFHFMANHRMPPPASPLPTPSPPPTSSLRPSPLPLAMLSVGKSIGKEARAAGARKMGRTGAPSRALHKQRCHMCRTRVGLLGFSCKCGATFCSRHRYSDTHACTVDHRARAREALAAANPLVVAPKLKERI